MEAKVKYSCFLILILGIGFTYGNPSPNSATDDPCATTICGIGAQCEKSANLILCVCPEDSSGDPFVECKVKEKVSPTSTEGHPSTTTSTESTTSTTSATTTTTTQQPTSTMQQPSTTTQQPSTTTLDSTTRVYVPVIKVQSEEIPLSQIASAPPTLSHFAHAHEQAHAHAHAPRPRPIAFVPQSNLEIKTEAPSSYFEAESSRRRTRPHPQQHDHHHRMNNENHHDHDDRRNYHTSHPHPHSQSTSTNFDLRQQSGSGSMYRPTPSNNYDYPVTGPSQTQMQNRENNDFSTMTFDTAAADQSNSYYKDPSGKYQDCRTVNNIIVCADMDMVGDNSGKNSIQMQPNQQQYILRPIAIRNPPFPTMRPAKPIYEDSLSSDEISGGSGRYDGPYGHPPLRIPVPMIEASYQQAIATHKQQIPSDPNPGSPESTMCNKFCGIDAICRVLFGRPICGCPEGHTGDPSIHCVPIANSKFDANSCVRNIDCDKTKVCIESQCQDPCLGSEGQSQGQGSSTMCGPNAKCQVIHHTPLCACKDGYDGNPYVGCVI